MQNLQNSENRPISNSNSLKQSTDDKGENPWKEKYFKVLDDNENLKESLIKEKTKQIIEDEPKKNVRNDESAKNKENEILNFKLNKLIDKYELLLQDFNQSEKIRREQSNLIITLQKEIEILRDRNAYLLNNRYYQGYEDIENLIPERERENNQLAEVPNDKSASATKVSKSKKIKKSKKKSKSKSKEKEKAIKNKPPKKKVVNKS